MANINAHLPPSIAVPFHPPTETLQHDNSVRPIVPKTKLVSSYTKLREDQERSQLSPQSHSIIQDESNKSTEDAAKQQAYTQQKRSHFFARRGMRSASESDSKELALAGIDDFKEVISVIQARYKNAVSPYPEPSVSFAI